MGTKVGRETQRQAYRGKSCSANGGQRQSLAAMAEENHVKLAAVAVVSVAVASTAAWLVHRRARAQWEEQKAKLEVSLQVEVRKREQAEQLRQSERSGRTRAEKQLREKRAEETLGKGVVSMPLIGRVRSCFTQKNGTPRNFGYVEHSRAKLIINRSVVSNPGAALEGIENFSHVWVLAVFHENTNLHSGGGAQSRVKAKAHPPRLGGESTGIFSCRTPHRPAAIALSLGKIEKVEHDSGTITVSGLDLIEGTPILDIKPYVPLYDSQPEAECPEWIRQPIAGTAPPRKREFIQPEGDILSAIEKHLAKKNSLFRDDVPGFLRLVEEVIAGEYDMRSASRKKKMAGNVENTHSVILDGLKLVFHWYEPGDIEEETDPDRISITAVSRAQAPARSPCNPLGV